MKLSQSTTADTARHCPARFALCVAALWWGSLTTIGLLVVPLLFMHLPTPAMAGAMAAKLFTAQTWLALACGSCLLLFYWQKHIQALAGIDKFAIILVISSLVLAAAIEFGVAPRIIARDHLKLWHRVGSAMYFLQWLGTTLLLWRMGRTAAHEALPPR